MSAFTVLENYGTAALARFVAGLALFLLLCLIRVPLLLTARVITVAMQRVDTYLSTQATPLSPSGPTPWQEAAHAHP